MATREEVLRRHSWSGHEPRHLKGHTDASYWACMHTVQRERPERIGKSCSRNGKHWIDHYAFCTQHAKMVRADLEKADGKANL